MFGHLIAESKEDITRKVRQLRLSLLFEELKELAEAGGMKQEFLALCKLEAEEDHDYSQQEHINRVEELDALADLQYVLSGAVLSLGFEKVFDEAFSRVHESNMSKIVKSGQELLEEIKRWNDKGVTVVHKEIDKGQAYLIYNQEGKSLKPDSYKAVNLEDLVK